MHGAQGRCAQLRRRFDQPHGRMARLIVSPMNPALMNAALMIAAEDIA